MIRLRRICQQYRSFSSSLQEGMSKRPERFWVIPVTVPLFSGYTYTARWNKIQRDLFKKHNLNYVVAMPLKEGKNSTKLQLKTVEELEKMADIELVVKGEGSGQDPSKEFFSTMALEPKSNNPVNDIPVLGRAEDVFPIGSICRVSFNAKDDTCLSPDLLVNVDLQQYENLQKIFFFKSKDIKALPMTRKEMILEQQAQLKEVIKKIQSLEPKNWPSSDHIKWEKWCGYLFNTTTLFSKDQIFKVYEQTSQKMRLTMLIECLRKYADLIEKKFDEVNKKLPKLDVLKQSYEQLKRKVSSNETGIIKYINEVRKELKERPRPPQINTIIESELNLMGQIDKERGEFYKKKAYLTYLLQYPFNVLSKDSTDLDEASTILDEDHYGMKKVKQRILEFMAVGKLKGSFKSKALILHGPPGVGKSSIAKSIARCLGRSYERIALGGETDPNLLRGHRRTYLASYPGKIFSAMNRSKTENPVILLDEIDKIDIKKHGSSIQDVILQVLDPMQNTKFKDNFLDIDIDLSNVLWICTANVLDTISPPLLDRLEQIEVTGYTLYEKKEIFKRYLIKKALCDCGLDTVEQGQQLHFSEASLDYLIENYCREAGVRSLSQQTQKLCQKIARKIVQGQKFNTQMTPKQIREFLGEPKYPPKNVLIHNPTSGMAIGLAYTGLGGCTLPIESSRSNLSAEKLPDGNFKKGSLLVTGNLQDVMKQSCDIAYTYAKSVLSTLDNDFLEVNDIHINFPQLQIGKDGPSAGIAITTTFLSLALDKPIIKRIGMTGEINLSGGVMKIGGVKEKVLGARRDGVYSLIFPMENKREVEELETEVKEGVDFVFVENYGDVMKEALGVSLNEIKHSNETKI